MSPRVPASFNVGLQNRKLNYLFLMHTTLKLESLLNSYYTTRQRCSLGDFKGTCQ